MANEFKIKKGLIVTGASGGTVVDIQGSQGQLFSVTDDLSGSIFAVSDISGVPILDVNSSGVSYFDGTVGIGTSSPGKKLEVKSDITYDGIQISGSSIPTLAIIDTTNNAKLVAYARDSDATIGTETNHALTINTNNTTALTLANNQNANFAGDVTVSGGDLNVGNSSTVNSVINMLGTNDSFIEKDTGNHLYFANNVGDKDIKFRIKDDTTNVIALTIDGSEGGDATFVAQAFSAATSSGDGSSTLTTKGYVDSLITGATIYRGAWDPSGGGYGSPDLSGVTQTSGYYYICSAAGTAEPNGTGTEPDTWDTGDWVIYNDVSGTGQWQKIDNSSVLSGVGTGQTVALWEGAGSVTDSETLGNAPITVSGNNTTFAGDLLVSKDSPLLTLKNTTDEHTNGGAESKIVFKDHADNSLGKIEVSHNGTNDNALGNMYFQTSNGSTVLTALELNSSQNATFSGRVTAVGFTSTSSNVYTGGMSSFETTLTDNEDWQNSPISILERGNVQGTETADKYAPNLNFHWGGVVSKSLWMGYNGHLNWGEYSATGIPAGDGRINATFFGGELLGTINTATTGVTQTAGDNSTKIATTAYADAAAAAVPIGNYLPLSAGSSSSLTDSLYINDVDQNNVNRYGNFQSEVGFSRSPISGSPDQWFKVVELGGSPKRIKFSIIATGDNTNSYDNFLISTSGYGMNMHIEKLPGGKYNTSKLLSVAAVNPSNGGGVEIWIKLGPVSSGTGATYVACTSDVLASATILASATTTAPTLTSNDTQLDISGDNRNHATIQTSRGATFGAKVGIGTNAPAAMLTVAGGDATITGNVGIGTTDTSRRLSVFGSNTSFLQNEIPATIATVVSNQMTDNNYHSILQLVAVRASLTTGKDSNGYLGFSTMDDSNNQGVRDAGRIAIVNEVGSARNSPTALSFWTNAPGGNFNTTPATEKMRITSTGNVGIGTTSPSATLELNSDTGNAAKLKIGRQNGATNYLELGTDGGSSTINAIGIAGVYADLIFNRSTTTATNESMRITGSGNVGIGTTSPDSKLEVAGGTTGILLSNLGDSSAYDAIRMTYNGYNSGTPEFIFQPKTAPGSGTVNSYFRFQTRPNGGAAGTGNVANVTVDGKIGIGTLTPGSKLSVDSVQQDALSINSSDGDGPYAVWRRQNGNLGFVGNANALSLSGNTNFGIRATNDLVFAAGGSTERMRINSAGNVGIGTANPLAKLDIQGTQGQLFSVTDDLSGDIFSVADISGVPILNVNSSGLVTVDGTSYFNGNVGIGTNNPGYPLEVNGEIDVSGDGYYMNGYAWAYMGPSATVLTLGDWDGNDFPTRIMDQNSSEVLRVTDGNVGIGSTTPASKLNVASTGTNPYTATLDSASNMKGIRNVLTSNTDDMVGIYFATGTTTTGTHWSGITGSRSDNASHWGTQLNFYTHNNDVAQLNHATQKMVIKGDGNVGIGVTGPLVKLHVNQGNVSGTVIKASGIQAQIEIQTSTAGDAHLYMRPNTTGNKAAIFKMTAGTNYNWRWQDDATTPVVFMQLSQSNSSLSVKGDIIAYGAPSDKRYKENIRPIESALDKAVKLQGVTFDWKESDSILDIKEDIGFIAQDVQKVVPELVRENEDGKLSLRYQGVTPILLEAIKELKAEIDLLKSKPCNCNNCNCSI